MEPPKFYDCDRDGLYSVHFANKLGLNVEQIREIFNEWGRVVSVTKAGDDYGYRFVRYKYEDEVKRCLEATRYHPAIKLLPKRPKQSNERQNENIGQMKKNNGPDGNHDIQVACEKLKITEKPNSVQRRLDRIQKTDLSTSENNDISANPNIVDLAFAKKFEELQKTFLSQSDSRSHPEYSNERQGNFYEDAENFNSATLPNEYDPRESRHVLALTPLAISTKYAPAYPESIVNEIPELVIRSKPVSRQIIQGDGTFDEDSSMTTLQGEEFLNAEEIVVANIPSDISVNYLLHLFQKHEPICVTAMKFLPSSAKRFCVVFFQTVQQADAVEAEFDNYVLNDKNLIVLRPQSLRRIAESA